MISRTIARLALMAFLLTGSFTMLLVGVSRSSQLPLPVLTYSNNFALHIFQPNCESVLRLCTERDRVLLDGLDTFPVAQWSPDGEFIAAHMADSGWTIFRADCLLRGQRCRPIPLDPAATDIRLAWGPDGSAIAHMSSPDSFLRIRTRGCWDGSPPESCMERSVRLWQEISRLPDWSANGRRLAFITIGMDIYLADLACLDDEQSCAVTPVTTAPEQEWWPSLSADGSTVVYSAISGSTRLIEQIFIVDMNTGERRQLTFRLADSTMPDWTLDRYVAFAGFPSPDSGNMNIFILDLQRGLTVMPVRNPDRDMYPNWGPTLTLDSSTAY